MTTTIADLRRRFEPSQTHIRAQQFEQRAEQERKEAKYQNTKKPIKPRKKVVINP